MTNCAYLRKSRADAEAEARGEGETLARHRSILRDLASRRLEVITEEYQEIVSGDTLSDRPQIRRLLADVLAGRWDAVYVMEIERLARGDTKDQGIVYQAFKYSGTKIVTPSRVYDPNNPADEEYFEFELFMSRREYKTINRRQQSGRMRSISEGKYLAGRPAYGYIRKKLDQGKGWSLEIQPEQAETVRSIFDWYAQGMGLAAICQRLNGSCIPSGTAGPWMPKRISSMLGNEIYIGQIRWGQNPVVKELTNGEVVKRRTVSKDYRLYPGLHEPIISAALWEAVQAARTGRKRIPIKVNHELSNPLQGLLICSLCGHHMIMKPAYGRQPESLHCHTPGCPNVSSYLTYLEDSVLSTLRDWETQYQLPAEFTAKTDDSQALAIAALENEMASLQKQLAKIQELLEKDIYTIDEYISRSSSIKADIEKASAKLLAITQRQQAPRYATIATLAPRIKTLLDVYATLDPARKNTMLKSIISRIDYTKSAKGGRYSKPDQFTIKVYPAYVSDNKLS